MLSCPVFVEMDPRQVFPSSNLCAVRLPHYSPKSFPLNLFADPHPLNRVASIFYKNVGGRGRHLQLSIPFHLSPYDLSPFFSHSCALFCTFLHSPKTQLSCFQSIAHSLHKNRGWGRSQLAFNSPPRQAALPLMALMVEWRRPSRTAARDFVAGAVRRALLGVMLITRGSAKCLKTISKPPLKSLRKPGKSWWKNCRVLWISPTKATRWISSRRPTSARNGSSSSASPNTFPSTPLPPKRERGMRALRLRSFAGTSIRSTAPRISRTDIRASASRSV